MLYTGQIPKIDVNKVRPAGKTKNFRTKSSLTTFSKLI